MPCMMSHLPRCSDLDLMLKLFQGVNEHNALSVTNMIMHTMNWVLGKGWKRKLVAKLFEFLKTKIFGKTMQQKWLADQMLGMSCAANMMFYLISHWSPLFYEFLSLICKKEGLKTVVSIDWMELQRQWTLMELLYLDSQFPQHLILETALSFLEIKKWCFWLAFVQD